MRTSTATAFAVTLALFALGSAGTADAGASRETGAKGINKCGTIASPGSYVVTRELSAKGDCILVNADFVTIDLAQHVISGDGTGSGVTDGGNPRLSVRVTDGTITNFAVALNLGSSAPVNARNLHIIANSGALDLLQCSANPLIVGLPSGIVTGSNSLVEGNLLRNNVGLAIKVGSGSIVANNSVRGTQSADQELEVSGVCAFSGSQVDGNSLIDNGALAIQANSGSAVTGNTARNNGGGIRANGGSSIGDNTVHVNTGIGIEVVCPSNLIGNTAVGNPGGNILLLGDGCQLVNNLAP